MVTDSLCSEFFFKLGPAHATGARLPIAATAHSQGRASERFASLLEHVQVEEWQPGHIRGKHYIHEDGTEGDVSRNVHTGKSRPGRIVEEQLACRPNWVKENERRVAQPRVHRLWLGEQMGGIPRVSHHLGHSP